MSKPPHRPAQLHQRPLASKSPLSWTMAKKFHENGRLMKTCSMLRSAFHPGQHSNVVLDSFYSGIPSPEIITE